MLQAVLLFGRAGRKKFPNTNIATITYKSKDLLPGTNTPYSWLGSRNKKLITVIGRLDLS